MAQRVAAELGVGPHTKADAAAAPVVAPHTRTTWPPRLSWLEGLTKVQALVLFGVFGLAAYVFVHAMRYWLLGAMPRGPTHNPLGKAPLAVHAFFGGVAIVTGPVLIAWGYQRRRLAWHRWVGRAYAGSCWLSGASGLALATRAQYGPVSHTGFGMLGAAWLVTTTIGVLHARRRAYATHRRWMLRSYALTAAAITFRLLLVTLPAMGTGERLTYQVSTWLCWVPQWVILEWTWIGLSLRRTHPEAGVVELNMPTKHIP